MVGLGASPENKTFPRQRQALVAVVISAVCFGTMIPAMDRWPKAWVSSMPWPYRTRWLWRSGRSYCWVGGCEEDAGCREAGGDVHAGNRTRRWSHGLGRF